MKCPECGAENPQGSRYCGLCLHSFETAPADGIVQQPPHPAPPAGVMPTQGTLGAGPRERPPGGQPQAPIAGEEASPPAPIRSRGYTAGSLLAPTGPVPAQAAIDKLSDIQPEDSNFYSLVGFAAAVAVGGAVFFRIAAELLARIFIINSVTTLMPPATRSQAAETSRTSTAGVVLGILILLGVVFALCFLVGWRSMRYGVWLGVVCGLVLCFTEGIVTALRLGSLSRYMELTRATGNAYKFPWVYFLAMCAAVITVGAFGGWMGEYTKTDRPIGNWPFSRVLTVVGGGLCITLALLGIGGLVKGAVFKPSKGGLEQAVAKMRGYSGWQADVYIDKSGQDERGSLDAVLLYQKDKGYYFKDLTADGEVSECYAVVPGGTYELLRTYDISGPSWEWKHVPSRDYQFFTAEKVDKMTLLKKIIGKFQGQECDCYQVEMEAGNFSFLLHLGDSPMGDGLAELEKERLCDADVWVSRSSGNVVGVDFLMKESIPSTETYRTRFSFDKLGEDVLEGVQLP